VARPPKHNGDAMTVKRQPGAAVTGRRADTAGRPRAGVALEVSVHSKEEATWPAWSLDSPPQAINNDLGDVTIGNESRVLREH